MRTSCIYTLFWRALNARCKYILRRRRWTKRRTAFETSSTNKLLLCSKRLLFWTQINLRWSLPCLHLFFRWWNRKKPFTAIDLGLLHSRRRNIQKPFLWLQRQWLYYQKILRNLQSFWVIRRWCILSRESTQRRWLLVKRRFSSNLTLPWLTSVSVWRSLVAISSTRRPTATKRRSNATPPWANKSK